MPSIFHDKVLEVAVKLNDGSNAQFSGAPNDIVHDAVFVLSHDAICVHRAIGKLVDSGWPSPASVLLRTLLDFAVSALAVKHSVEPTIAAFRFMYAGSRRTGREQSFPPELRAFARKQAKARIEMLPPHLRDLANEFLKERERAYWFNPEWRYPKDLLLKFGSPELQGLYSMLSGPVHGSFYGMRIFREDPDALNVNPELPPGPKALSVDFASCRLTLAVLGIRASVEKLVAIADVSRLSDEITAAASVAPRRPA